MIIYNSLTERLKNQHLTIEQLIAGIGIDKLITLPAPDKWSASDHVAHLTRYQKIFIGRLNQMLNEDIPVFDRYNGDFDPEFTPFRSMSLTELQNIINADRVIIFDLPSGLNEPELSCIGVHPKYGRLTILKWAEFFVLHEAHHLLAIFQLVNGTE